MSEQIVIRDKATALTHAHSLETVPRVILKPVEGYKLLVPLPKEEEARMQLKPVSIRTGADVSAGFVRFGYQIHQMQTDPGPSLVAFAPNRAFYIEVAKSPFVLVPREDILALVFEQ